jgi:hypothetical protein
MGKEETPPTTAPASPNQKPPEAKPTPSSSPTTKTKSKPKPPEAQLDDEPVSPLEPADEKAVDAEPSEESAVESLQEEETLEQTQTTRTPTMKRTVKQKVQVKSPARP